MADSWVPVMNTVSLSTQRSATSNAATSSKDATTTRDSVFSEVLLEALAKDWVLSVLNALPMPGADEGVTPAEDALWSPVATSEMESGTGRPGMSTRRPAMVEGRAAGRFIYVYRDSHVSFCGFEQWGKRSACD
ncbi:hypothetical protein [Alicyclobacillus pomorum]|uniref:hypothetical protein n=1 Tax=Alicyclobacillus pomorum TaxID=204470 RepID=UPI000422B8DA|nr:hypothetical protein [Alicyclobacillus pomorum]